MAATEKEDYMDYSNKFLMQAANHLYSHKTTSSIVANKATSPTGETRMAPKTKKRFIGANNSLVEQLFGLDGLRFAQSLEYEALNKVLNDLSVLQSDESRKAVTLRKELKWQIKNEKYQTVLQDCFTPEILNQILSTYLQGLNVFEVNWTFEQGLFVPSLVQRDYRQFDFLDNGQLGFKQYGQLKAVESYKAVYATYRRTAYRPLGDGLMNKVYFPVRLKNASLQFWAQFLERFGSPWAVGKTDMDAEELGTEIHAMLNGDTAVIDPEESIDLLQPKTDMGGFERMAAYCDAQINKAILGANLTGQVSQGSKAAATVHNDIREDLANADRGILEALLNAVIGYFKAVNGLTDDIKVSLRDQDDPRIEQSKRDKTLYEMGYQPKQDYIEKTYNIEVQPINNNPTAIANTQSFNGTLNSDYAPFKRSLNDNLGDEGLGDEWHNPHECFECKAHLNDAIDDAALEQHNQHQDKLVKELQDVVGDLVKNSNSFEEVQEALLTQYKDIELEQLQKALKQTLPHTSLYGALQVGEKP